MAETESAYADLDLTYQGKTWTPDDIMRTYGAHVIGVALHQDENQIEWIEKKAREIAAVDVKTLSPESYAEKMIEVMPTDQPQAWTVSTTFDDLDNQEAAFEKADRLMRLNNQFMNLASNIIHFDDTPESGLSTLVDQYIDRLKAIRDDEEPEAEDDEKASGARHKRENGIDFPASDFAYVPDPMRPSTWKLRLTESPGKVTIRQLGRAAAALSSGGFRGQKAAIPDSVIPTVKRRIRAEYRKLGVETGKMPAALKEESGFTLFKNENGSYNWLAVYSNNFRDDDHPREIISKQSHENFVKMVDDGVVDPPELWHWHTPGTRWGVATWVDYVSDFAIAFGTIDPGHEKEAEALSAYAGELGVSHGMPQSTILRDPQDETVILFHVTREISDLPWDRAANKHTGFWIKEDDPMSVAISPEKRQYLLDAGLSPDKIDEVEKSLAGLSGALKETVESKSDEAAPDAAPAAETPNMVSEIAGVMIEMMEPIIDAVRSIKERLDVQEAEMKELRATDSERLVKAAAETPAASLRELVAQGLFGGQAQIKSDDRLVKNGPKETREVRAVTGIGFFDAMAQDE